MRLFPFKTEPTLMLAKVDISNGSIQVYRLNAAHLADIKAGVLLWVGSAVFFGGLMFAGNLLNLMTRQARKPPMFNFPSINDFWLLELLCAAAILINLLPALSGLRSPKAFVLDHSKNELLVEGQTVGRLSEFSITMQSSFGWTRRAFRLVLSAAGKSYVIAHTQKFTIAALNGSEYALDVLTEDLQGRNRFDKWRVYAGETTGFDRRWPEYQEIVRLYDTLIDFMSTPAAM